MAGKNAGRPVRLGLILLILAAAAVGIFTARATFFNDKSDSGTGQSDSVEAGAAIEESENGGDQQSPDNNSSGQQAAAPADTANQADYTTATSFFADSSGSSDGGTGGGTQLPQQPQQTGSLSGIVEGEEAVPVPNVQVYLADGDGNLYEQQTVSGPDGSFSFSGLTPGEYKLYFSDPTGVYEAGWYGGIADPAGVLIAVEQSSETKVIHRMLLSTDPFSGAIAGQVMGPDGNGVSGVQVNAYLVDEASGTQLSLKGTTESGSNGYYRLSNLPPGDYKISFIPTDGFYSPQWYRGQSTHEKAEVVPVNPGETVGKVNAVLTGGGTISGHVNGEGQPLYLATVDIFNDAGVIVDTQYTDGQGYYKSKILPSGSYKVRVSPLTYAYTGEWYSGKTDFATADEVNIKAGEERTKIDFNLVAIQTQDSTVSSTPDAGEEQSSGQQAPENEDAGDPGRKDECVEEPLVLTPVEQSPCADGPAAGVCENGGVPRQDHEDVLGEGSENKGLLAEVD